MEDKKEKIFLALIGTVIAVLPQYLLRYTESAYMYFQNSFSTYSGDLWNFFANYIGKGLHYLPEYPVGIRFIYEATGMYKIKDYTSFFTINSIWLTFFAIATTYLMYLIIWKKNDEAKSQKSERRVWLFWIFAPSFLFYGLYNYDLVVVFFVVLSIYLFGREMYYAAATSLALGTVLKVFPIFLLPVLVWKAPPKARSKLVLLFAVTVIVLNMPYILTDLHSWLYPYVWQISTNITTSAQQGTYWWLLYPIFGHATGWLSLCLFFGLSTYLCYRRRNASIYDLSLIVMLLFLLTDRIYSPQYNLYLLPFLVLSMTTVPRRVFYLVEIPNVMLVFFIFYLREHAVYLQIISFIRYFALIWILIIHYRSCSIQSSSIKSTKQYV